MMEPTGAFMPDPRVVELQQTIRELQVEVEQLRTEIFELCKRLAAQDAKTDEFMRGLVDEKQKRVQAEARLREVLATWVNGRKVVDGIPLTLRRECDAALAAAQPKEEK